MLGKGRCPGKTLVPLWTKGATMNGNGPDNTVAVTLEGGPAELPRTMRVAWADDLRKIKLPYRNGHEHFELVEPLGGDGGQPVFRWTTRTKIAE